MSVHLPLIQQMFPNQLVLDINEMAQLINSTPLSIYAMIRDKELPFKLLGTSRKIQVLVVEIASYLDGLFEKQQQERISESAEKGMVGVVLPKKRGRPRGSLRNSEELTRAFQTQLAFAVCEYRASSIMHEIEVELSQMQFPDDQRACVEKYEELKGDVSRALLSGRNEMKALALSLFLDTKDIKTKNSSKL